MNIFILDHDLDKSAEYHVDKHVVKMPLEAAQLLTTALYIDSLFGYISRALVKEERDELNEFKKSLAGMSPTDRPFGPYLPTAFNHPCSIWVRTSFDNYAYTFNYAHAVGQEYTYRYGKQHASTVAIQALPAPNQLKNDGLTSYALALSSNFPPELKDVTDPVKTYRYFYMLDKAPFATWKYRNKPYWWDENIATYESRISRK